MPKPVLWLKPEEERAWHDFQLMQMQLNAALSRQLARDSELSASDYAVLVALTEREEHSMRAFELARELGWEKSRLSHHLRRMSERDLVKRQDCTVDGRGQYVALTERGREAIEDAAPGHVAAVRALCIDLLSEAQVRQMGEIARVVLEKLADSATDEAS